MTRDLGRRRLAVRTAAALTLTFAAQAPASAQRDTPQRTGGWLERDVRQIGELTTAQRAAAIATLDRIERLFRQVPDAIPDGFEIQPVILGGALQDGPGGKPTAGSVVEYILTCLSSWNA